MQKLPNNVDALLKALDEEVPHPDPRPGQSIERIMYDAGRRSLVDQLLHLRDGGNTEV